PAPEQLTADMITRVDEQAIQAVQAMLKDRKVAVMNAAQTLFNADKTPILSELSDLLDLPLESTTEYYGSPVQLPDKTWVGGVRTKAEPNEHETTLSELVDTKVQALGERRVEYDRLLQELVSIEADVARLKDQEHHERWSEIAPARKTKLNRLLADPQAGISWSQIYQFLVKGTSATDPIVQ